MKTKKIKVGNVYIGGGSPITVQSMTNTPTYDIAATIDQIILLEEAGCDIVRVSIPDKRSADGIAKIRQQINIPLVADIHFDHRLAIRAIEEGADKIRINPGNIGGAEKVKLVARAAIKYNVPIRIGVNAGSVEEHLLKQMPVAEALVASAMNSISLLESEGVDKIVLSVKASGIKNTIDAYRALSKKVDYPLHIGLTESGVTPAGIVKSSIAIGTLLQEGIGDTIRVSLTADPVEEIEVGKTILRSLGLRDQGIDFVSCPTCARCEIDLISLANKINDDLKGIDKPLKIAVMGCGVNGPREAAEADIGIAAGKGKGVLFAKGEVISMVKEEALAEELIKKVNETPPVME